MGGSVELEPRANYERRPSAHERRGDYGVNSSSSSCGVPSYGPSNGDVSGNMRTTRRKAVLAAAAGQPGKSS